MKVDSVLTTFSEATSHRQERFVEDSVHGEFSLHAISWDFVDTRQFQRLREIKQLGVSYLTKPCASHTRFEHSLGVAHLARRMVEHLQEVQPQFKITFRDVLCVELAGLCHDLGHGPYSHVWDGLFMKKALEGTRWSHEEGSEMMFDYLLDKNKRAEISSRDAEFVKALIAGDPERCRPPEKRYLFDIVANHRNGIDVDKLIRSARVIDDQICYDVADANQIYELCYARYSMYKEVYTHETTKAFEYMVVDALLKAQPYMKLAEMVERPDEYAFLTDSIIERIASSTDSSLEESRRLIDRIYTRDRYKTVGQKYLRWEDHDQGRNMITPSAIVEAAKTVCSESKCNINNGYPTEDDILVDITKLHYGMKNEGPLDFVKFYSRDDPDRCRHLKDGEIPSLVPPSFGEILVRVYARNNRHEVAARAGCHAVLRQFELDVSERTPSPCLLGAPDTPSPTPSITVTLETAPIHPSRRPSFSTTSSQFSIKAVLRMFRTAREKSH